MRRQTIRRLQRAQAWPWWLGTILGLVLAYRYLANRRAGQPGTLASGWPARPATPARPVDQPTPATADEPAVLAAVAKAETAHASREDPAAPLMAEAAVQAGEDPAKALALATEAAGKTGHADEAEHGADDLTVIDGIGRVRAQHLRQLGITTMAQLATADAEALRAAAREAGLPRFAPEGWIEQAKRRLAE